YNNIFIPGQRTALKKQEILDELNKIREILIYQHNGLFQHLVDNLINKIHVFGLHFASLDIRQESSVHNTVLEAVAEKTDILPRNYSALDSNEKKKLLSTVSGDAGTHVFEEGLIKDTLLTIKAIREIQQYNGAEGCNRYIISQCNSALNVLEVYALFCICG